MTTTSRVGHRRLHQGSAASHARATGALGQLGAKTLPAAGTRGTRTLMASIKMVPEGEQEDAVDQRPQRLRPDPAVRQPRRPLPPPPAARARGLTRAPSLGKPAAAARRALTTHSPMHSEDVAGR